MSTEAAKAFAIAELSSHLGNQAATTEVGKQRTRVYEFVKTAADGTAATTTAEAGTPWNYLLSNGRVRRIIIKPTAALTGDPTNNAVITVSKRDAAGGTKTTLGTITTTASWVAGVNVSVTLTAANLDVVAGGALTCEIAKGGTGVVVPICRIIVEVEDT